MTLLWENASPTSSYAAQAIAVNYAPYDLLVILISNNCTSNATYKTPSRTIGAVFDPAKETEFYITGTTDSLVSRKVTVTSDGLSFSAGAWYSSGKWNDGNNEVIPIRVYGLIGVT